MSEPMFLLTMFLVLCFGLVAHMADRAGYKRGVRDEQARHEQHDV